MHLRRHRAVVCTAPCRIDPNRYRRLSPEIQIINKLAQAVDNKIFFLSHAFIKCRTNAHLYDDCSRGRVFRYFRWISFFFENWGVIVVVHYVNSYFRSAHSIATMLHFLGQDLWNEFVAFVRNRSERDSSRGWKKLPNFQQPMARFRKSNCRQIMIKKKCHCVPVKENGIKVKYVFYLFECMQKMCFSYEVYTGRDRKQCCFTLSLSVTWGFCPSPK